MSGCNSTLLLLLLLLFVTQFFFSFPLLAHLLVLFNTLLMYVSFFQFLEL